MGDEKKEQRTDIGSVKSIQAVPVTRPGRPLVARWRHWHFKSSIILMLLGAFAVIVYLLRSGLAKQYEAFAAPLCAIACGGFLVWHAIHLFAEQDAIEEQNEATADKETNLPAPPPGS